LIVDDNEFNIYTLQKLLECYKIFVDDLDISLNGKEAIDKVLTKACHECGGNYKLILMDLNMPVMDGFKATKYIKGMIKEK